jgi:hypothetical protein
MRMTVKGMPYKVYLLIVICAVIVAGLMLMNSLQSGCIIRNTTGVYCPGCGGKRALVNLLNGAFLNSLKCNALLLPAIFLMGWILFASICRNSVKQVSITKRTSITLFLIATVYTIIRNIDSMTMLRP